MDFKYKLSQKVEKFLEDSILTEINIGCSDSQVVKIEKNSEIYFLKIAKDGLLTSEFQKLNWLKGKLSVPTIVLYDKYDNNEYLITTSINGDMVCGDYYLKNPMYGINVITNAFQDIYSVDISECPFNVDIEYKLNLIEYNVKNGLIRDEDLKEETLKKYGSVSNLLKYLKEHKFHEEKCFSHGDTSLPNIFAINNKFSGFIDVGECGIADKWFDLAICEKSIRRNYGEEYINIFYKSLNIIPDRDKIDYYLLMMELYL